jgi:DNA-binding FadR family transcriptional regulator
LKQGTPPLSAAVQKQIIDMILKNDMKPGDRLPTESELCRRLNVSRGTVREAVKALISQNVLVVRQGSGTFISPRQGVSSDPLGLTFLKHDQQLALDLLDVRLMLEPNIAELAAIRATARELRIIEQQCNTVQELIEKEEPYQQADVEFHRRIAQASHNQVVSTLVPVIHSSATLNIDLTKNSLKGDTIRYHRALANAISSHDPYGARYAMILHLATNRQYLFPNEPTL